ncbi:hypothetical protein CBS9595_003820 [Malassezia furfur]|nr:hypothetical protein CBS9595_003820 [Malassezia furfur]
MEPFDEQLASRVSALSDDVDEMTERVVAYRKRIPSAYAQAVQQRSEALSALIDAREERRQRKLRKSKPRARFPALMKGEPLLDVEAKTRTEEVLRNVYTQLHQLRSHTAEEQQRLVNRLRQMPP